MRIPYPVIYTVMLIIATVPAAGLDYAHRQERAAMLSALQQQQPSPTPVKPRVVIAVTVCTIVDPPPPDAKPETTTLDCGKDFALEVPRTYATFPKGTEFRVDRFDDGGHAFSKEQPDGSVILYAPPCPRGYERRPLQAPPCNPELRPE